jgi:hypothetical protein
MTELFVAVAAGEVGTAQVLLLAGASPDEPCTSKLCIREFGFSPLMKAATANHSGMVQLLLDAGANPHYRCKKYRVLPSSGKTAAEVAVGTDIEALIWKAALATPEAPAPDSDENVDSLEIGSDDALMEAALEAELGSDEAQNEQGVGEGEDKATNQPAAEGEKKSVDTTDERGARKADL